MKMPLFFLKMSQCHKETKQHKTPHRTCTQNLRPSVFLTGWSLSDMLHLKHPLIRSVLVSHTWTEQITAMALIWRVILQEKPAPLQMNDTCNAAVNSCSTPALYLSGFSGAAAESQSGIAHHPSPTISLNVTCQAALISR